MLRENKCDSCGEKFSNKDKVVVLFRDIEVEKVREKIRLKLSENSVTSRAFRVYCSGCLDINHYITEDQK
jgi:hypothetical protein